MGLLAELLRADAVQLSDRLPGGAQVQALAPAVWAVQPPAPGGRPLLLSAGIHGDETAPVELLCSIVDELLCSALAPRVPLLIAFGNLAALRAGRRYLDDDLNRLFGEAAQPVASRELPRAAVLKAATAQFCAVHGSALHFDLHSAIRDSRYPCFAIAPLAQGAPAESIPLDLLAACGIEAVLLTTATAPTFSAYTTRKLGCTAYTFELGRVREIGAGAVDEFAAAGACLRACIRGVALPPAAGLPRVFRVSRELIKQSEAFELCLGPATANFTALARGDLIARDGDSAWYAEPGECIVFPNPAVKPGLRAGLLVVAIDA
ncbi:succinylglutamate desuccinylase [Niveibacterium sp. 24ML]|uniref:succinylglutamate desuccinylase n=1 Tax=Niveibacterium sp. 24ML TaxID=2985512 RepID=UPI0022713A2F|nr:succinylglutamate desuccinylase [Niveibacterium sp. 24ML]MCX9156457.1 succinylglutamate desuccinylase [Niveibacterium sp. 24ML]